MDQVFLGEHFEKKNFRNHGPEKGEYENCAFKNCDFSNADLSFIIFINCAFTDCNLSLAKLMNTAFRDVVFRNCKMLGLHFENCNDFGLAFSFDNCQLNHSSFYQRKIKKTVFKGTLLQECDFTEADLSGSTFTNCDFTSAMFDRTNLEKADLRGSQNYSLDPEKNKIKKANFSLHAVVGLLDKYGISIDVAG